MKSHVGMEHNVCPICTKQFPTGAILLDTRLKESLERETVTGWDLCPECKDRHEKGYIALVAVRGEPGTNLKPDEAYREGLVVHLRREAALRLIPELKEHIDKPFVWAPKSICEQLVALEERRASEEAQAESDG